jgi:hypothetical protein
MDTVIVGAWTVTHHGPSLGPWETMELTHADGYAASLLIDLALPRGEATEKLTQWVTRVVAERDASRAQNQTL